MWVYVCVCVCTESSLHLFKPHLLSPLLPCFFHLVSDSVDSQVVVSGFLLDRARPWVVIDKTREKKIQGLYMLLCVFAGVGVGINGGKIASGQQRAYKTYKSFFY